MAASLRDEMYRNFFQGKATSRPDPSALLRGFPLLGPTTRPSTYLGRIVIQSPSGALAVDVLVLRAPPESLYHYLNDLKFILADVFVRPLLMR